MKKKGLLEYKDFGYSMPVSEPLFNRPPFKHEGVDRLNITFETEYDPAARIVPQILSFADEKPKATLVIANFKNAAIKNYKESILMFHCEYQGKKLMYMPSPIVSCIGPMITGRELWGYPKKYGIIDFEYKNDEMNIKIQRPTGRNIFDVKAKKVKRLPPENWVNTDGAFVKLIPSAEENNKPDVCQIVGCKSTLEPVIDDNGYAELWRCNSSITHGADNENDPWGKIPVINITRAIFGTFNTFLNYGYIIHDYLK